MAGVETEGIGDGAVTAGRMECARAFGVFHNLSTCELVIGDKNFDGSIRDINLDEVPILDQGNRPTCRGFGGYVANR